jgi:hypothetical protein
MNKEAILSKLDFLNFYREHIITLKETNKREAVGLCPFHEDTNPSFSVNLESGLYHCFGCQAGGDVFSFYQNLKGVPFQTAFQDIGRLVGLNGDSGKPKVVSSFKYQDEAGRTIYWKERIEPGRDGRKKEFFFYCLRDGQKVKGRGRDPLPYNLPALTTADGPIYFVEGEAKVDLLTGWGLTATCLDNGSTVPSPANLSNWRGIYLPHFQGKEAVYILPDNDDPDRKYADFLAGELKSTVRTVKVVPLPGLPPKGDIIDWREAGGTKENLIELTDQFAEWNPVNRLPFLKSWEEVYNSVIEVEYLVDRLLPKDAITVLFGRGGIGKTYLAMGLARSVGAGIPFLGLETRQTTVVYIDFENPMAVLTNRTQKLGEASEVFFWLANDEIKKAPKLDSPDWEIYKTLPKGSLLIVDTLRSSQSKDEDKSQDMAIVLGRLKELRDLGFTVILLHHTPKNSDRVAKGSTAIVDLSDHILGLNLVRKKADGKEIIVEDDDEDQEDAVYRFGWREKTRFEPFHLYLTLNPDRGFELAPDPQEKTMELMAGILEGLGPCAKGDFYDACKVSLNMGQKKARHLVDQGAGRWWEIKKDPLKNRYNILPKNLKPAASSADFKNSSDFKPAVQEADLPFETRAQSIEGSIIGNPEEVFCRFADLDIKEGVV